MTQPEADVVSHDSPNGMSAPVHSYAAGVDEPPPPPLPRLVRRRLPMATLALALLAFGAVGFLVGVKVEKSKLPASNAAATSGSRLAALGGGPTATASANPSGAAAPTGTGSNANIVGTVTVVDGTTLYVTDTAGNTVKVTTNTGTTVTKTVTGAVKDLAPGQTVVIRGVQSSVGVYAAQSVTQGLPTGGFGGGGFGGGGGGFGGGGGRGRATTAPSPAAGNG
jgi:uncharacterized membrane protein YgcG